MEKYVDWKRIGWTVGIIAFLVIVTCLNYFLWASHWTTSGYDYSYEDKSSGIDYMSERYYQLEIIDIPVPQPVKILGSIGCTLGESVGLIVAGYSLVTLGFGIYCLSKNIIRFYYHKPEVSK